VIDRVVEDVEDDDVTLGERYPGALRLGRRRLRRQREQREHPGARCGQPSPHPSSPLGDSHSFRGVDSSQTIAFAGRFRQPARSGPHETPEEHHNLLKKHVNYQDRDLSLQRSASSIARSLTREAARRPAPRGSDFRQPVSATIAEGFLERGESGGL
jgi:hypothetical protein